MPIQLATPFNGGDLEAAPLTHVKILSFQIELRGTGSIHFYAIRGHVKNGNFIETTNPIAGKTTYEFLLRGNDFKAMTATLTSAPGLLIYDEVANTLYQWLIDHEHFAGIIV